MYDVEKGYQMAKDFYAQYGVDVDRQLRLLTEFRFQCTAGRVMM